MVRDNLLIMESKVEENVSWLGLTGELIAESRFDIERVLREWHEAGVTHVIVRCRGLNYIDSAGLSTLLGALHRYRRSGGDLVLAELNPALNSIFEITSMEKYFKI